MSQSSGERREQLLLYVMGTLDGYHLTAQGKRDHDALVAAGFKPTDEEIAAATKYLEGDVHSGGVAPTG